MSQEYNYSYSSPRTPTRGAGGNRTPFNRTPTRQISAYSRPAFKPPKAPDFFALTHDSPHPSSSQNNHNEFFAYNPEKEPIKAYLRIRPQSLSEASFTEPYLQIVDDLEVCMTPSEDSNAFRSRNRTPERYKFTKIFSESVTQEEFFNKTTLPLIHDVLRGENALIFAYGVTNSGKTYSIMGTRQQPGLLPRTLDVIFNSIDDYKSEAKLKPFMHSLVQLYEEETSENRDILSHIQHKSMATGNEYDASSPDVWQMATELPLNRDRTTIAIDTNFEYGIWVSFAEIYTERIYDLLVSPDSLSRKRKALSLKYEHKSGHKYIAGLKEIKVKTIDEAYAILFEGQRNRAEYSTITNQTSSRSHSIFTIRIVRAPIDSNNYVIEDPTYATVSKFSIVDLAGSERYRNTLNSGQRLKEAGNINKSLMVLGQCMETLRLNQLKIAIGKKKTIVPYRHSKLTELFKSSFEGDGKAVMVVNVNPFNTGFDENSHVMKFAAVAKDVATWRRVHPKLELKDISKFVNKRLRTTSKRRKVYCDIDSLMNDGDEDEYDGEEEEEEEDDDEDEASEDPFVDNLIAQIEDLRNKWLDAETRCATMESDIRQQVTKETEAELKRMEEIYMTSLRRENDMAKAEIRERLNSVDHEDIYKGILRQLQDKQNLLSTEMDKLCIHLNEHEATKHSLLEKIAELQKDKQRQQERLSQLTAQISEKDATIESLRLPDAAEQVATTTATTITTTVPNTQPVDRTSPTFIKFLDLRRKLRRSIFRNEEYSHDADVLMAEIEQFKDVTFPLVKETSMGKLMKLIVEREFKNDPYNIHQRSQNLLNYYIKLSISSSQQQQKDKIIVLNANNFGQEQGIRTALGRLKEENSKLKHKLKLMQEGHKRLKKAFDKTWLAEDDHNNTIPSLSIPGPVATHPQGNTDKVQVEQEQEEEFVLVPENHEAIAFSPMLTDTSASFIPSISQTEDESDEEDLTGFIFEKNSLTGMETTLDDIDLGESLDESLGDSIDEYEDDNDTNNIPITSAKKR
ncbi:MAG: kinesin motor domain-containing protein [Benjaminiella poitrasii]|nr:MAG: kinesin motor domain-containing protein [Benjaminiella poitrasii]